MENKFNNKSNVNNNKSVDTGVLVNEYVKRVQFIAADKQPDYIKKDGEVIIGKTWVVGFYTTSKDGVLDLTKTGLKKSKNGIFEEKIELPKDMILQIGKLYLAKFGYKQMQNVIVGETQTSKWVENKPSLIEIAPLGSDFDYFE